MAQPSTRWGLCGGVWLLVIVLVGLSTATSDGLFFNAHAVKSHQHHLFDQCMANPPKLEYPIEDIESEQCHRRILHRLCSDYYMPEISQAPHVFPPMLVDPDGFSNFSHRPMTDLPKFGTPRKKIRIAYFIIANSHLNELFHLIERIWTSDDYIAIHVDAKTDPAFVGAIQKKYGSYPNIVFVPAYRIIWGGIGMLKSQLHALHLLRQLGDWDFTINLSETCYPVVTSDEFRAFLGAHPELNFITMEHQTEMKLQVWTECQNFMYRTFIRRQETVLPVRLGSQWYTLNRAFVDWMFTSAVTEEVWLLMDGLAQADEKFMNTLLYHSPFRSTIVPFSTRWSYYDEDENGDQIKCTHPRYTERNNAFLPHGSYCGHGPGPFRLQKTLDTDFQGIGEAYVVTFVRKMLESDPGSLAMRKALDDDMDSDRSEWTELSGKGVFTNRNAVFLRVTQHFLGTDDLRVLNVSLLQRNHHMNWVVTQESRAFLVTVQFTKTGVTTSLRITPHMQAVWRDRVQWQLSGTGTIHSSRSAVSGPLKLFTGDMYVFPVDTSISVSTECLPAFEQDWLLSQTLTRADVSEDLGSSYTRNVSQVKNLGFKWQLQSGSPPGEYVIVSRAEVAGRTTVVSRMAVLFYEKPADMPGDVIDRNFKVEKVPLV